MTPKGACIKHDTNLFISIFFYFVSSSFRLYYHLLTIRGIRQHSLSVVFTLCNDIHAMTSALIKRANQKCASSTNLHWLKGASSTRIQTNKSCRKQQRRWSKILEHLVEQLRGNLPWRVV